MDLSGLWRAAIADDDLRRDAVGFDYDDSHWEPIRVPSHWRTNPAFSDSDGPVLYRTRFEWDPGPKGARSWVAFDGVCYQSDIWLDGAYLGDTEGYFVPHAYEVTDLARIGEEHSLAIEVACSSPYPNRPHRTLTGALQDPRAVGWENNPGGIWQGVRIERTGPVRIDRMSVVCLDATPSRATIQLKLVLDSDAARTVRLRTSLNDLLDRDRDQPLATGHNEVSYTFGLDNPALWWPHALGAQNLCTVGVEVYVDSEMSHARHVRTGLRQIAMKDWVFSVNGERLFIKGVELTPADPYLGDTSPERVVRDIDLAMRAGLDLVRVGAHVSRRELYEAADAAGMLIWQDMPMRGSFARTARKQALRQAEELVYLLGHHPSVALWCGHDEPVAPDPGDGTPRATARHVVGQFLPSWNRTVLDAWVRSALRNADPSRPAIAHSGVLPHPPQFEGTDTKLELGWTRGEASDLERLAAALPRLVRFVTGLSPQSVPYNADFADSERWPALDWGRLSERHGLDRSAFDQQVPPLAYRTFDEWRDASLDYQAKVVRLQIERLRRLRFSPTGGFVVSFLADAVPAVSSSLIDHRGQPKPAFDAVRAACQPVIVVVDELPSSLHPADPLGLDVHVVSDLRTALTDATIIATVSWTGGDHVWGWQGDILADSCSRVGSVDLNVPDSPGPLTITVTLAAGSYGSTTSETTTIRRIG